MNNPMQMIQQYMQFRRQMPQNPQQAVQTMLNNGQISQESYNAAVQNAQALYPMIYGNRR